MYKYIKLPLGLGEFWFEWKRDNTQIYDIEWCCGELFICIGVMRIIFTPTVTQPKKINGNGNNNKFKGCDNKPSRSSISIVKSNRAVS